MKRVKTICSKEDLVHCEAHKVANFIWKKIKEVEALLIIEKDGRPIETRVSPQFEHDYECKWLKSLATLVSIRYPISNFHKQLNGLEMTVNIFKEKIVIVKSINTFQLLIVIIPKFSDLIKAISVLSNEQKWHKS